MNENENESPSPEEAPLVPPAVSQAASQLGRRGRGRPKQITDEDRQRRSDQMKEINARRVVRIQGVVVNGPRGATTVPQVVKATPLVQPVTNPALIDQINRAAQTPPPWQGQKVARVQGRRAE